MKNKVLYIVTLLILICVFLVSSWQLLSYWRSGEASKQVNQQAVDAAVEYLPPPTTEVREPEEGETVPQIQVRDDREYLPISVDFEALYELNSDVSAWLYNPGSKIHYPVVQSSDNEDYLHHMLDGTYNSAGTLFIDYRDQPAFSGKNTIIYGHNMKNGTMFGTLCDYKEQSYYDAHPYMYLLTPEADYRLELVAGVLDDTDAEIYNFSMPEEQTLSLVQQYMEESTFQGTAELTQDDRFVTLSTCSYEFQDARYVVIGVLREIPRS